MHTQGIFDVVIVGAGPIGLACGIEAARKGLKYLIVDKGCLVNSIYHYPVTMTFFSSSDKLEIGGVPFISINARPTRSEALEYYRRVAQFFELRLSLFNALHGAEQKGAHWVLKTAKGIVETRSVILATGFYGLPNKMGVPGEDLPKVSHYYRDPNYYALQKVLVVGAMNSAVDAALETWRKGAEVTMVVRGNSIGERVKYWVRPDIENRINEGAIKVYYNSTVKQITTGAVTVATPDGDVHIDNDFVLALTGYLPDFSLLHMFGVNINEANQCRPDFDEASMVTNAPGVYLAGVVCGGLDTHSWFIENARVHARRIIDHLTAVE